MVDILDLPAPAPDFVLPYGPNPLQFGELRLPRGPGPHPVAIAIHGGFWRAAYDLAHLGHLCAALAAEGIATWSLEYRRIGHAGGAFPGTFTDVATGADHIRRISRDHHLDLSRAVAIGHSAGGQLALWLAGRARLPRSSGIWTPDPLALRGVVSLAGVSDLPRAFELNLGDGVVGSLLGGTPAQVPQRYAEASPRALLPFGIRIALVHGADDDIVPASMSGEFIRAARTAGDDATLELLQDTGHFELIDPRTPQWATVLRSVRAALSGAIRYRS